MEMALTQADLEAVRGIIREEGKRTAESVVKAAMDNLGLFSGTEKEITERRADNDWTRKQRRSQERLHETLKRSGWLAVIAMGLGAVKLGLIHFVTSGAQPPAGH